MPLTAIQQEVLALLARSRASDRYLAGGAALHRAPSSRRFSDDIDFFHDSIEAAAESFRHDSALLETAGYNVEVLLSQPGFIRALVSIDDRSTLIDWARDSAWRFMPLVEGDEGIPLLHEIDLAINKVLALAGRDEARDFVDVMQAHDEILPLGAMVWAAVGKDPGFTPASLIEQLKRRGRFRPGEVARLALAAPLDLAESKSTWRTALAAAAAFIRERPHEEAGCLYYSPEQRRFVAPSPGISTRSQGLALHRGRPGGILPRVAGSTDVRAESRHHD